MEERKTLEVLFNDSKRFYDAQCKKILSLKKVVAYLFKECLSEYKDFSLEEVYDLLDEDHMSCKMVSQNVEYLKIPDSLVRYDLLFELKHPKNDRRKVLIDMEPQGIDPGGDALYHRAFYYVCRLISGQRNDPKGFTGEAYEEMHKIISFWICLRHANYKDNQLYRYYVEEKMKKKDRIKQTRKESMEILILYPRG